MMNILTSLTMLDIERLAIQSGILRVKYPNMSLEKINDFQCKVRYGEMEVFGTLSGKMDQLNIERLYNFAELIINDHKSKNIPPPKREPLGEEIKVPCGSTQYMFGFKDGVLYAEKEHDIGVNNEKI